MLVNRPYPATARASIHFPLWRKHTSTIPRQMAPMEPMEAAEEDSSRKAGSPGSSKALTCMDRVGFGGFGSNGSDIYALCSVRCDCGL